MDLDDHRPHASRSTSTGFASEFDVVQLGVQSIKVKVCIATRDNRRIVFVLTQSFNNR